MCRRTSERERLRRHYRQLRRSLSPSQRQREAQQVARWLGPWIQQIYPRGAQIGLYYPLAVEVDPLPLAQNLGPRYRLYLPRVGPDWGLAFAPYDPRRSPAQQGYRPSRFGIWEPPSQGLDEELQLDLLLLPCLAVDREGGRLGQGGGCYDRYLAQCSQEDRRPLTLALAYTCQQSPERLPLEPWDQPIDGHCSARGLVWTSRAIIGGGDLSPFNHSHQDSESEDRA